MDVKRDGNRSNKKGMMEQGGQRVLALLSPYSFAGSSIEFGFEFTKILAF
jgi:hypothetical protein